MVFSSIPFLYYFLPAVLILYLLSPKKLKNFVLLLTSLVFYAWGEPKYVIVMAASILINYICGTAIEKYGKKALGKLFLGISLAFSLGSLGYFKYADFFIANFNRATGLSLPLLKIALPIGISFYTFQILSYTVDVYRKKVPAQKNLITLAAYVTLFPQLIAGPIVRYSDVEAQLVSRKHSFEKISEGIRRFIFGLSKKALIANVIGELCNGFLSSADKSVGYIWLYVIAFMLQVYFDFSGYSDMAIGLGKMFGFDFMENFNYPFISKSISEFWRRWHISLGSWFRDYVYIPMGGNRVSKPRLLINIFTVWFLTGFWHGAEWNFILWGVYFGILMLIEKYYLKSFLEKSKVIGRIYVGFFMIVSFAIFSAGNLLEVGNILGGMLGFKGLPLVSAEFFYAVKNYGVILVIAAVGSTPLMKNAVNFLKKNKKAETVIDVSEIIFLAGLLFAVTAFLADSSFNPFLYFRF